MARKVITLKESFAPTFGKHIYWQWDKMLEEGDSFYNLVMWCLCFYVLVFMPGIASYVYGTFRVYGGARLYHRSLLLCFLFQLEEALVWLSQPVNCRMAFFFLMNFQLWECYMTNKCHQGPIMPCFGCVTFGKHVSAEQYYQVGKEML